MRLAGSGGNIRAVIVGTDLPGGRPRRQGSVYKIPRIP
jgi:hypothetical protein